MSVGRAFLALVAGFVEVLSRQALFAGAISWITVSSVGAVCTLVSGTDAEGVFRAHLDPCLQTVVRNRGFVTSWGSLADASLGLRVLSRFVATSTLAHCSAHGRLASDAVAALRLDLGCALGDLVLSEATRRAGSATSGAGVAGFTWPTSVASIDRSCRERSSRAYFNALAVARRLLSGWSSLAETGIVRVRVQSATATLSTRCRVTSHGRLAGGAIFANSFFARRAVRDLSLSHCTSRAS
mmetsp:Transcript_5752/g.10431  ORF Transcript_5752/g.10431 Transcript_5752/m.10431 type:complete len:241 (+) Transcript_5752:2250-2972(+)